MVAIAVQASPEELAELLYLMSHMPEQANAMLETLRQKYVPQMDEPLWKRATPEELKQAIREWANQERPPAPPLPDEALRRENLYE